MIGMVLGHAYDDMPQILHIPTHGFIKPWQVVSTETSNLDRHPLVSISVSYQFPFSWSYFLILQVRKRHQLLNFGECPDSPGFYS